jgi:hypothetical protein
LKGSFPRAGFAFNKSVLFAVDMAENMFCDAERSQTAKAWRHDVQPWEIPLLPIYNIFMLASMFCY